MELCAEIVLNSAELCSIMSIIEHKFGTCMLSIKGCRIVLLSFRSSRFLFKIARIGSPLKSELFGERFA